VKATAAAPAADWEALPDAVVVLSPAGIVLTANSAAGRLLLGTKQGGPLTGTSLPRLMDDAGRDWWACERVGRGLRSVTRVPEQRLHIGDPDGPAVLLTARYVRAGATREQLDHVVVTLRDGSGRDRLERAHADLISTVAHELRSPLTSVKGFSATMLAKWERFSDDQKRQMLEWINGDADRVTRLLSELLDVSRIDSGRLELHREVVDLAATVERAFAGRIAGGEPADRFALEAVGEPPEMWLDPDKIEQVVANLVENALRHGAGAVHVSVIAEVDGATVLVDDEGEGVPDTIAPRIFSKFFRGKARRGGTGLGLYIVKGMIEAHGGTVSVGRAPRGGARFRFRLPAGKPTYIA
jgi:signal transduction histidine kinase